MENRRMFADASSIKRDVDTDLLQRFRQSRCHRVLFFCHFVSVKDPIKVRRLNPDQPPKYP